MAQPGEPLDGRAPQRIRIRRDGSLSTIGCLDSAQFLSWASSWSWPRVLANAPRFPARGTNAEATDPLQWPWQSTVSAQLRFPFPAARAIASPLSKTEKIVFMGAGGDGGGPSAMISEIAKSAEMVNETLQSMTGVGLSDMLKGDASLPGLSQVTTPLALSSLASNYHSKQ